MALMRTFQRLEMRSDECVSEYIARVMNVVSALTDIGEEPTPLSIMVKIIDGLPPKFNVFVTAWGTVEKSRRTLEFLEERLVAEEKRMGGAEERLPAALLVARKTTMPPAKNYRENNNNNRAGGKQHRSFECFSCHEEGHRARDCPKKKNKARRQNQNNNTERGNDNNNRERGNNNNGRGVPVAIVAAVQSRLTSRNVVDRLECSAVGSEDVKSIWLTDSGASQHMTHQKS